MEIVVFKSPRKKEVLFDKFTENNGCYLYWSRMCPHCHNEHKKILDNKTDIGADGVCGILGCSNKAKYFVEFYKYEASRRRINEQGTMLVSKIEN